MRSNRLPRGVASRGVAAAVLIGVATVPAGAQSLDALATSCVTSGGLLGSCSAAAVASRSAAGQIGLLAGLGSEVSGTASTLGTRVTGGPRLSFTARVAALSDDLPDPADATQTGVVEGTPVAVHVGAAIGLFDGLRLMPTVGGFLSLDAFGQVALVTLPAAQGFDGGARAYTAGVRVGVFREGFTMPGVSVSASRRFIGSVAGGTSVDVSSFTIDPRVTSLRATVGKDVHAVELLAGVGWDRYEGDVTVTGADGAGGVGTATGEMRESRRLYFASAAMTFSIVLSMSVEGGWARGFAPATSYSGAHDAGAATPFGSFSLRLVL